MIMILVGLMLFNVFLVYCCLVAAKRADERLEKLEWDKEQKLLENKSQEIKNMEKTIGRE